MTKRTTPKRVMCSSPSTPIHNQKYRKENFSTPTSHHIDDEDIDTSPYSLSYSQIAGVEVTWGKRKTPVPSKSKPHVRMQPDTPPPITRIFLENDDEQPRTPCKFFKFKKKLERMGFGDLNTDSGQGLTNADTVANKTESSTNDITPLEDVGATKSNISNSINLKQLLDDSIDMDLILCSQQVEQDVCRIVEPVNEPIASKGFVDGLNSNDNDDSLFDDPLLLDDHLLMQKSIYPRHKSMYPTSTSNPNDTSRNANSNNVNSATAKSSVPPTPSNSKAKSSPASPFSRHKSWPSTSGKKVSASTKQCTPQEIELKKQQANAKLRQKFNLK